MTAAVDVLLKDCARCGRQIPRRNYAPAKYQGLKYCSTQCVHDSQRLPTRQCETCGHDIPRNSASNAAYAMRRYCSYTCRQPPTRRPRTPHTDASRTTLWMNRGLCTDEDPEQFFPEGQAEGRRYGEAEAVRICLACPVRGECLAYALDNRIEFGVWGGLTETERTAMKGAPA